MINKYNSNGEREGYWEFYYDNGKLSYEGNYINGKEDGIWKSYFFNCKLISKGNYINGEMEGLWDYFNSEGVLIRREINVI